MTTARSLFLNIDEYERQQAKVNHVFLAAPASKVLGSFCSPAVYKSEMDPAMSKINAIAVPANNTKGLPRPSEPFRAKGMMTLTR
jgi:hypothetical protein